MSLLDNNFEATQSNTKSCFQPSILEMLVIQNELNKRFVGEDWCKQANERTRVNYCAAILEEAQELQACNPAWKWWKKPGPVDHPNTCMELVDLMHFAMSEALAGEADLEQALPSESDITRLSVRINDAAEAVYETLFGSSKDMQVKGTYNRVLLQSALHALVASVLQGSSIRTEELEAEELDAEDPVAEHALPLSYETNTYTTMPIVNWHAFWSIAFHAGLSVQDVYITYLAKSVLNAFRMANGDKELSYKRHWFDGKEDNALLMEYVSNFVAKEDRFPSAAEVNEWLQTTYQSYLESLAKQGSVPVATDTSAY